MRWSKRTILILLSLLVLMSITFRYPLVEHERYQTDSYFIHHLSDSIVTDGMALWIFHPLSYIGYYPLSYPSGAPFIIAEFSMLSGLSVELSILVVNIIIAALFCLGVFLLSRHFVRRSELAILVTTFAILGPRFVDTSYWDGSARAPVLVLMILAIVAVLRSDSSWNARLLVIWAMLILGSITIHHMSVLLLLFGLAYFLTGLQTEYVQRKLQIRKKSHTVLIAAAIAVTVIFTPFVFFDYFWDSAVRGMQGSSLINIDSQFLTVLLVGLTSYTNQIGLIIVFGAAYILLLVRRLDVTARSIYPVFVIVVFLPLFGETLYVSMILSPFLAILGVLWFGHAFSIKRRRRIAQIMLVVLVVASVASPIWSVNRWNSESFASGDRVVVDNQIFNDAYYAADFDYPVFGMCNVVPTKAKMETLSGVGFLGSGISLALNKDVTREDVLEGLQGSASGFPKNIYNWYEYPETPLVDRYVRTLMIVGLSYLNDAGTIDGASEYFSTHSRMLVVIDNRWASSYLTTYSVFDADLPQELLFSRSEKFGLTYEGPAEISSYMYYQSNLVTMYLVELPIGAS